MALGVEKMMLPLLGLVVGSIIAAKCITQDESLLVFVIGGLVGTALMVLSTAVLLPGSQNSFEVYQISNLTVEDACKNILLLNNITLKENEYLNYSVEDYNIICKIDTKSKEFGVILK
jgi:hypothetical protein